MILLKINHLFSNCEVVTSTAINTNYFIQHYSLICTQLNGSKYCYVSQTITLDISPLFAHN